MLFNALGVGELANFPLAEGLVQRSLGQRPRNTKIHEMCLAKGHSQPNDRYGKACSGNLTNNTSDIDVIATRNHVLGSCDCRSSRLL